MLTATENSLRFLSQVPCRSSIPFVSLILYFLLKEKAQKEERRKSMQSKTPPEIKSKLITRFPIWRRKCVGYSRVHLFLSDVDSGSDKETADMSCDHQQIIFSSQQTYGKIYGIIVYPLTITGDAIKDLISAFKKN
ncbi:hypothetical protein AVEN_6994-1 [Araneus ventricosus]|uniref:Uncharacterized protein n=1 Tax=Araneus ventricosus TaxID=182803 RepID=A0A4Y2JMS5_ARAVE|nr:hypothetical protein AVEN_6994-1 [Araneus ventricosus]